MDDFDEKCKGCISNCHIKEDEECGNKGNNGGKKKSKIATLLTLVFLLAVIVLFSVFINKVITPAEASDGIKISKSLTGARDGINASSDASDSDKSSDAVKVTDPDKLPFKVTLLDVGQGLSVLLDVNGHYIIYDGGGRESSSYVVSYLKQHGISEIDMMLVSHYDEDHISGLVGVLNTTEVGTVITPDYEADTKIYASFRNKLSTNGADEIKAEKGAQYQVDGADILILGPSDYSSESENDRSVVVKISYNDFSCIITGDAEKTSEEEMLKTEKELLDTDLYIVGHHGSSSSSDAAFVAAMSPEYAFISVGEDNSYGHPTVETMETLNNAGCKIYRTDVQDEITLYTDGEQVQLSEEPFDESMLPETTKEPQTAVSSAGNASVTENTASGSATYVLNTNSKKFHYPTCSSVSLMKDKNKKEYTGSRDEIIAMGYDPCKNCNP